MNETVTHQRQTLLNQLIGAKIPRLWCPPLTHYTLDGGLDKARMAAHWAWMLPNVNTFLVPGSTGDGWEMNDDEIDTLLDFSIELAMQLNALLLVGVLRTDVASMRQAITETLAMLKRRTGLDNPVQVLQKSRVCGFTVCPPGGAELSQNEIRSGLESVLELRVPVALYQLPQVTQNEMSAALVAELAEHYANFILLKDTSGNDRVALEDKGKSGVFLVRGAEGNYAQWLQELGGPYHGLLLSTANCFSAHLKRMITELENGNIEAAKNLSDKLTQVATSAFELVSDLPDGNPFTNANKAIDHFMAQGSDAKHMEPPRLHAGSRLSQDLIKKMGEILEGAELLPQTGYLST